ncbi:hypothetical protein E8K88_08570 [Lampropedia aestuarii]|uniref:Uncharacterized protein n=1 Tax=Lampropedia aestuarii TaxID=2562762 RepID=A0A4S5BMA2_9BURK|nr:hypothetical protein [Lampropedia aestuarii]THJ33707.1 hypothetical protein E8K88_08570 [Lampropedia aestuarii]
MLTTAHSSARQTRIGHVLAQCAASLGMAALLMACGDGYRGYFIWGNKPPAEDDDSGLVIIITKSQLSAAQEVRPLNRYQTKLQHSSAALQSELSRLQTTDEARCELGAVVYELELQWPQRAERYRSNNWSCSAAPAVHIKDYISAVDLARFAQQLAKEQ